MIQLTAQIYQALKADAGRYRTMRADTKVAMDVVSRWIDNEEDGVTTVHEQDAAADRVIAESV